MRLSITVPAYQVQGYLPRCLDSLLCQSLKDIEVLVVDDGSTDDTGRISDSFANLDRRVRVIHQENKGLVAARKVAAIRASAEYVACIDGDDYVDHDYCERLLDLAQSSNADVVVGGHVRDYHQAKQLIPPALEPGTYCDDELEKVLNCFISRAPFFSHGISTYLWGKLFRKRLYLEAQQKVPDGFTIGEDAACVYPLIAQSKTVAISASFGYHYVQRQSSMLKGRVRSVQDEFVRVTSLIEFLRTRLYGLESLSPTRQLQEYELSQLLLRSGGLFSLNKQEMFLLGHRVYKKARLAIYSAGTFGQTMLQRVNAVTSASSAILVDDDWSAYRADGLPVFPVDALSQSKMDFVAVASLDPNFIRAAKSRLAAMGVPESKIIFFVASSEVGRDLAGIRRLAAGEADRRECS